MNRRTMLALGSSLAFAVLLPSGTLWAQDASPFTFAETGQSFASLQEAVDAIGSGRGTIHIAPGRYSDCAVQEAGHVAFVAESAGTAIFDGGVCEGKATLVLRGRSARVEGLVFTHQQVPDGNGAGIRIEEGDLAVAFAMFVDAQSGILSASDPSSAISIDRSTFSGLGRHPDGDGAHALYVGGYGALRITNSRFERGTGGHYVKSRTPRIEVLDSSFDDSAGRDTNYMIDLSEGAIGRIAGNVFVQGTGKENYGTLIAVAPEGNENGSAGLVIERNEASLAPGFRWTTTFVGDWSGEPMTVRQNRLGRGIAEIERR